MKKSTLINAMAILSGILFVAGLAVTIAAANNLISVSAETLSATGKMTFIGFAGIAVVVLIAAVEHRPSKSAIAIS